MAERIQPKQAPTYRLLISRGARLLPKRLGDSLFWDTGYILGIVFLEQTIIPWFTSFRGVVDLMTPLVTAIAITQSYTRSIFLGLVAGMSLESHMTIPAGTFISSYLVVINVLMIIREIVSWRQLNAWIIVSLSSVLWVFLFETFVKWITSGGTAFFPLESAGTLACRFLIGLLFCTWLATKINLPDIAAAEEK